MYPRGKAHQLTSYIDEFMWRERYGRTAHQALLNSILYACFRPYMYYIKVFACVPLGVCTYKKSSMSSLTIHILYYTLHIDITLFVVINVLLFIIIIIIVTHTIKDVEKSKYILMKETISHMRET